jgi:hypothetical protein
MICPHCYDITPENITDKEGFQYLSPEKIKTITIDCIHVKMKCQKCKAIYSGILQLEEK